MSDPFEALDREVAPPPLDWRDRLVAALDAAGLPRPSAGIVFVALAVVAVVVVVAAALAARSEPATDVTADLPYASSTAATTTTTAGEVLVHVAGSVAVPGVHVLAPGDRVVDAVDAAGGATAEADLGRLNLAALVQDGERIYVPAVGEVVPDPPTAPAGGVGDGDGRPLDLNTATEAELETLPGVGPAIAAAIVGHRDEFGPFASVDELLDVSGIGEARLAALRDLVTV